MPRRYRVVDAFMRTYTMYRSLALHVHWCCGVYWQHVSNHQSPGFAGWTGWYSQASCWIGLCIGAVGCIGSMSAIKVQALRVGLAGTPKLAVGLVYALVLWGVLAARGHMPRVSGRQAGAQVSQAGVASRAKGVKVVPSHFLIV